MARETQCNRQTDCAQCPKATEGILVHRKFPKGQHFPPDKCTQNCILFILQGELLVNSEEYPGTTLREGQFILQSIGSKLELLALTDVNYVVYWFNEPPLICEQRYHEILQQSEAPLTYTPLVMTQRITNFMKDICDYLDEQMPCGAFIDLKCQELIYLIICYYPIPQLSKFFYPISSYTESFQYFVMQNYEKVKNVEEFAHLGGYTTTTFRRLFKNMYGVPVYEWILSKKEKASWKTSSIPNNGSPRSVIVTDSTLYHILHISAKLPLETLHVPFVHVQPEVKNYCFKNRIETALFTR